MWRAALLFLVMVEGVTAGGARYERAPMTKDDMPMLQNSARHASA